MKKGLLMLALSALFLFPAACNGAPRGEELPLPPPAAEQENSMTDEQENHTADELPADGPALREEPLPEEATRRYLLVGADGLNVRTGAGTDFAVLGQAQKGTLLALEGETEGWYRTSYRGKTAYVSRKYAEETDLPAGDARTERVIGAGERLLGVPYVYGAIRCHDGTGRPLKGFTEEAFDCSSLLQYLFYGEGVLLGVTTRTQVVQGTAVPWEDIRRGDLLFFTNDARKGKTGLERVGHVALYLGEGYILHTASDFAKIEPISPKRRGYFLAARRML